MPKKSSPRRVVSQASATTSPSSQSRLWPAEVIDISHSPVSGGVNVASRRRLQTPSTAPSTSGDCQNRWVRSKCSSRSAGPSGSPPPTNVPARPGRPSPASSHAVSRRGAPRWMRQPSSCTTVVVGRAARSAGRGWAVVKVATWALPPPKVLMCMAAGPTTATVDRSGASGRTPVLRRRTVPADGGPPDEVAVGGGVDGVLGCGWAVECAGAVGRQQDPRHHRVEHRLVHGSRPRWRRRGRRRSAPAGRASRGPRRPPPHRCSSSRTSRTRPSRRSPTPPAGPR